MYIMAIVATSFLWSVGSSQSDLLPTFSTCVAKYLGVTTSILDIF